MTSDLIWLDLRENDLRVENCTCFYDHANIFLNKCGKIVSSVTEDTCAANPHGFEGSLHLPKITGFWLCLGSLSWKWVYFGFDLWLDLICKLWLFISCIPFVSFCLPLSPFNYVTLFFPCLSTALNFQWCYPFLPFCLLLSPLSRSAN